MSPQRILITGAAGFIGSQLMRRLIDKGHWVFGIDNLNNHLYKRRMKEFRVNYFKIGDNVEVKDIRSSGGYDGTFNSAHKEVPKSISEDFCADGRLPHFDYIIHLAAHAGVRDSFGKEADYHSNNIDGTQEIINYCKYSLPKREQPKIIYASTSSVYGGTPISENGWKEDFVQAHQLNAYAYTKYVNECQFKTSGLRNVGLRFFTVYGPWGRPDMALFQFTKKILDGEPIDVYNYGDMKRDFTYIDDILDGIELVLEKYEQIPDGEIFNIGRGEQVQLMDFIKAIEKQTGKTAQMNMCPKHPADTQETWSNTEKLQALGYSPKVSIDEGVERFYDWYSTYMTKIGEVTNG
jgi:UDP-glucuronate 4-epimerase